MTKEEISKHLHSNLDAAAELSANDAMIKRQFPSVVYNTSLKCFDHSDLIKQFKAGAKWMAEQGYTQEGIARPDDDEIWVNMKNTDIKDGDEVIVQIRKK